ncbi:hypothetical protein [Nocardioides nitrophenolicus]|uniref:hypothetical protein n=1 Tax=Nocardioides nitrophenolicus TaxID=60489 RepID=UPI000B09D02A|nr:hypothetical protein [Nocardioides nitrophenolicus]MBM7517563.1 hypothetical protein [Nocardioides nitrophenolicus]
MVIVLALPAIFAVAAIHRFLQLYAPTNLLVRQVRAQEPRCSVAAVLSGLATTLLVMMHLLGEAVANGGPGWLNLAVLMLALGGHQGCRAGVDRHGAGHRRGCALRDDPRVASAAGVFIGSAV